MKISTFEFCLVDGIKDLKRNLTTTIASSIAVSISILLISIFLVYNISIQVGMPAIFNANERYCIDLSKIVKIINILVYMVLPLISILIVSNSIKVSIFSKKQEIQTMKLIGATDRMIILPFIIKGVLTGIIGEVINIKMILIIYVLYGVIISVIGSMISIRIHLRKLY